MKCAEVISMLDSLLDNELPTQVAAEMMAHLKDCLPCSSEWEQRLKLRDRLHALGNKIDTPANMIADIHKHVRDSQPALQYWRVAAAACAAGIVVLLVSLSLNQTALAPGHLDNPPAQVAVKPVRPTITEVLSNESHLAVASTATTNLESLSQQAGFNICPLDLPGWQFGTAQLVKTADKKICLAKLTFMNAKSEKITCYQTCAGQIQIAELNRHNLDGKLFCCGKVCHLSVVYWPKDGHDVFLVAELPQADLLNLAQQG